MNPGGVFALPWVPQSDDDFPTLGWLAIDWMSAYLARPDIPDFEPLKLYAEQEDFILRFYELDPKTGRRKINRGVISRPRGWGKSPFAGMFCAFEGLGPAVFAGWDAYGQPVGRPWADLRKPIVQIAAVSETQTQNTYDALLDMLESESLYEDYPGLEPMGSFVNLPRGQIQKITASASSVKGNRAVFGIMDQTEVWTPTNGGKKLAETMRSNAAKLGGATLETPNAFIPGMNSVAELSSAFWSQIQAGEVIEEGLYFDHREAPPDTDMSDPESLLAGLRVAYGDAAKHEDGCVIHDPNCDPGHVDLHRIMSTIWDTNTDPQLARSDFLNQITHASDSYVSQVELRGIIDSDKEILPGDEIVLGFDGSRGRARGKADATALVGMRVADKHLFDVKIWERKQHDPQDWAPPVLEVDAVVRDCFERYNVLGFYADPSGWQGQVAEWEAKFFRKLKAKASRQSPMSVWPRGKNSNVSDLVEMFREAIALGEISMSDSPQLIQHFLNARRRATRTGYLLYKDYPDSPDKIDAVYAAMMAYKACLDAVQAGYGAGRARRTKRKALIL